MTKILARLTEPSTWAGLAVIIAVFSPSLSEMIPAFGDAITKIVAGVLALLAVVNKDPGSEE